MAQATEGFSGADLQALVYNAQLEIIHEAINASPLPNGSEVNGASSQDEEQPVEYTVLSGPDVGKAAKSRAEEAAFQKQVSTSDRPGYPMLTSPASAATHPVECTDG